MKKLILFACFAFAASSTQAQNVKASEVPGAVKNKFSELYPGVKDAEWELEDGNYEAGFDDADKMETSVLLTPSGNYLRTENEIAVSGLPKGATEYAAKHLPGKKIKEACKITDNAGRITYAAEIGKDEYIFDATGKFLKKIAEDDDDDDEDKDKD